MNFALKTKFEGLIVKDFAIGEREIWGECKGQWTIWKWINWDSCKCCRLINHSSEGNDPFRIYLCFCCQCFLFFLPSVLFFCYGNRENGQLFWLLSSGFIHLYDMMDYLKSRRWFLLFQQGQYSKTLEKGEIEAVGGRRSISLALMQSLRDLYSIDYLFRSISYFTPVTFIADVWIFNYCSSFLSASFPPAHEIQQLSETKQKHYSNNKLFLCFTKLSSLPRKIFFENSLQLSGINERNQCPITEILKWQFLFLQGIRCRRLQHFVGESSNIFIYLRFHLARFPFHSSHRC